MKVHKLDLIDFEKVNTLLEGFNKSTGFVTAILDFDGNVLSKSGWRQICTEFHRINPETAKKCTISDTELAGKMAEGETYHFYKCLNGLIDVAVPVVINGEHIANLFSGQFFFEEPDISFFKKQAEKHGFDENKYLAALKKVPVVSREKVKTAMDFLLNMTQLISETTFQKLEQMELNKTIEESEKKFKSIFETKGTAAGIFGEDKIIRDCNAVFESMVGYSKSEIIDKLKWSDFVDKDDLKRLQKYHSQRLNDGDSPPSQYECSLINKTGELINVIVNIALIGENRIVSLTDITERKQAEDALKKSEAKYRLITENMAEIITTMDMNLNFTYVSPSIIKLRGFTVEEALEQKIDQIMTPESFQRLSKVFAEEFSLEQTGTADPGRSRIIELEEYKKDGSTIWIENTASFIRDSYQKPIGIISISRDITDRKKAEAEWEKIHAQLNQAQKMESVGRLAGGVAHDFNNMLGVILGHIELAMLRTDKDHDLYSDLKEIQAAAKRSADITKQLLAFARKQTISPRRLDLNDTVENMLNMLRRLIGEDIDLVWKPSAHLWPVKMDPSQIDQILANLCVNARDAISGVGKLTIETGIKSFDEEYCKQHAGFTPGDFVLLAVSDNGCGMDKDVRDNLFEPFFTTKEVGKGTGLGLATVYGIVKQNNGFINVYSEPGQGSTFRIYLPRLVVDEDTDNAVPDKKAAAGGTETILLVEDEPSILRMTRMMLERKGYTVLSAATPSKAVEKAKNHSGAIDLLMTDVVMPEMNGRDLAKQITVLYPGIPLLFMSGYTANVIAHQEVLDDGVAFIQKPFSMAELAEKLRDVLDTAPDKAKGNKAYIADHHYCCKK